MPDNAFVIFGAAVVLGLLPAWIASRKGREFPTWWFFGTVAFVIALLAALLIRREDSEA